MVPFRFRRISVKIAITVVLLALLVSAIATTIEFIRDYNDESERQGSAIQNVLDVAAPSAARAVLTLDRDLAAEVTNGLIEYDFVIAAEIVDDLEEIIGSARTSINSQSSTCWLTELLGEEIQEYTTPLTMPDTLDLDSGSLSIMVDNDLYFSRFYDRAIANILTQTVETMALALIIFVIFYVMLTKPLMKLAEELRQIGPDAPGSRNVSMPQSHADDELGHLVRVTNRMIEANRSHVNEHKKAALELSSAKEAADAANQAKSSFLANMSHELRTPLNAIVGFTSIMKDEMFGPLNNKRYKEYVGDIQEAGTHLASILGNILDLAKVEAQELKLEPEDIDIQEILQSCFTMLGVMAKESELSLKLELESDLPTVEADRLRLKQVLINLISNAIKFTPEKGRVTVTVVNEAQSHVKITVSDTGPGIAADKLEDVLKPFVQANMTLPSANQGVGLGLSLSKSLVELHGGTLSIHSNPGEGTSVEVRLPWKAAKKRTAPVFQRPNPAESTQPPHSDG